MTLSDEELEVLSDRRHYMVKAGLVRKLDGLYSEFQQALLLEVGTWNLPVPGIDITRGKIFRGENHASFPYTLLDFPRMFNKESVFALRSMCWWGNEFSFALHIQGKALEKLHDDLSFRLSGLATHDLYFCIHDSPWHYDFGAGNYRHISSMDVAEMVDHVERHGFLKIGRKLPLEDFGDLVRKGVETARWYGDFLGR